MDDHELCDDDPDAPYPDADSVPAHSIGPSVDSVFAHDRPVLTPELAAVREESYQTTLKTLTSTNGQRPSSASRPSRSRSRASTSNPCLSYFRSELSVGRLPSLPRLGNGGQRLIACPLLEAALELFRRGRCCAVWMANDPYDLAHAPATTGSCRRPIGEGGALAVSAAAVTDHVRDRWHGRAASQASISRWEEPHAGWGAENSRNLHGSGRESIRSNGGRSPVSCATQPDRRVGRLPPASKPRKGSRLGQ
jgi:hypothetical protein